MAMPDTDRRNINCRDDLQQITENERALQSDVKA
jgi:hypothetical protein